MKAIDFKKNIGDLHQMYLQNVSTGFSGTFNNFLIAYYTKLTGGTTWNTFKKWKELGYTVKKGESSFPVFSRPLSAIQQETGKEVIESHVKLFFTCHLFNEKQVIKIEKSIQ